MDIIVAVSENWGIGKSNKLLFNIPDDMARFRALSRGKTLIMGRETLESLPGGKPLPGRRNIVLTHRENYDAKGAEVVGSFKELFELLGEGIEDAALIGGGSLFSQLLSKCRKAYVTKIFAAPDADRYFPDLDADPEWVLESDEGDRYYNDLRYRFLVYSNKTPEY